MLEFARRCHWALLACSTSFLLADFIGHVTTVDAQQSQSREAQDPRTSAEAASFDGFLDTHPEIDAQLRSNPLLINDQKWLQEHRDVLTYFDQHPQAKKEIAASPSYFIGREGRRATREARLRSENSRNEEVASFREFLNSNPQIAKQLNADPALIKQSRYLAGHPGLQAYLDNHPLVSKDLGEDPGVFLPRESRQNNVAKKETADQRAQSQEKQTDGHPPSQVASRERSTHDQRQAIDAADVRAESEQHGERPSRAAQPGTDQMAASPSSQRQSATNISVLTASEITSFDQFLGNHKKINKDLEKHPGRVRDTDYLKKNRDLQDYLDQHTGLREELLQHPEYFMNRRNRYELSTAVRNPDMRDSGRANSTSSIIRLSQRDLRASDRFLEKHKKLYRDLEKNPSLAADPQYLNKHKDFREFLEQNPDIHAAMGKDPGGFMQNQHDRFERMGEKM